MRVIGRPVTSMMITPLVRRIIGRYWTTVNVTHQPSTAGDGSEESVFILQA
jgi:hypothetical protein